jgi:hypothetical protein
MPAHNENFPWMSYYGNYNFFEQRMREHSKVRSIKCIKPGLYNIELITGQELAVFVCECYSFDIAEYYESLENYGQLNAIVISSNWCGYSLEVKRYCIGEQVGVFDTAGFMAAINRHDFWTYLDEYEREKFRENGWI